jgi:poly(A) polymerase
MHIFGIGEKFGTIQIQYIGYPEPIVIEITTYRGEQYQADSRKPEVQFTSSLYEDLKRRDFTINAIAKNALSGEIVDPFNGLEDIKIGYIRAVDNPTQRFIDDPLRLLRAVRFAAQFDFSITATTKVAMVNQANQINKISQERIRDEVCKMLLLKDVSRSFELLNQTGLLIHILPEVQILIGVAQPPHHSMDVFNHTMTVVEMVPARLEVRLAALLHDIAKPATKTVDVNGNAHFFGHEDVGSEIAQNILIRLRFGNDIVEHIAKVVKLHMRINQYSSSSSHGTVRRLFVDAGDCIEDLLDLAIADGASDRGEPQEIVEARINELRERFNQVRTQVIDQPIRSPLDGNDLMKLFGRGPGAWLKPLKQHLNDLVIEGFLQPDDREGAIAIAKKFQNSI